MKPDALSSGKAWDYALRLLNVRARSAHELAQRLRQHHLTPDVVSQTLSRLTAAGLIDDAAFAQWWAETRRRQGRSGRVIRAELRRKGVAHDVIDAAAAAVGDEQAAAQALAAERLRRLTGLPNAVQYRRLTQWLARRGFESDVVREAVTQVLRPHDATTE